MLQNPHGSQAFDKAGERLPFAWDDDDFWAQPGVVKCAAHLRAFAVSKAALSGRREGVGLPPIGSPNGGLFAMSIDDYRARFTQLDAAMSFLPELKEDAFVAGGRAWQVAGIFTEKCGGADEWWRNPRMHLELRSEQRATESESEAEIESTAVTVTLDLPDASVLERGLKTEDLGFPIGFKIIMNVINQTDSHDRVRNDTVKPQTVGEVLEVAPSCLNAFFAFAFEIECLTCFHHPLDRPSFPTCTPQ